MINIIPSSWEYTEEMENLFLFYQASEEMLSFSSPDTYRLTVHTPLTLCFEIKNIFDILEKSNEVKDYYKQYIVPIIEELTCSIQNDSIIKSELGARLPNVISGLTSAKDNSSLVIRWINLILQSCSFEQYLEKCKERIVECVISGKNKKELLYYTNNYYVSLVFVGYNVEFLYQSLNRFFDNKSNSINDKEQISKFLEKFNQEETRQELYLVMDTYLLDTFEKIAPSIKDFISIKVLDEKKVKKESKKHKALKIFYENYQSIKNRENKSMVSYKTNALDPYGALEFVEKKLNLLQTFVGYFKHREEQKIFFDVIQKENNNYFPIKARKIIPNRPYIDEKRIEQRIVKIIDGGNMSSKTAKSIVSALGMHLEAITCKNEGIMLRTFWTATEALFLDPVTSGERESATYALLRILEKTYLLKILRTIFAQIQVATQKKELENIKIDNFKDFLIFYCCNDPDGEEFKKLTGLFEKHPLLRFRIYSLRKELIDSKHIKEKIEQHNKKIYWQILRIYRTRNLSTHAGINMQYINEVLFNLHNYFDYVVNYIICKLENDEYITDVSTVVFEAKTDNLIHLEMLKEKAELSKDNCFELLFGPDKSMILYEYETN